MSSSKQKIHLKGALGSSFSFSVSTVFNSSDRPFLLIFDSKEEAAYYLNDFEMLLDEKQVLFYPGSYRRPYHVEETDNANILLRAEVLNRINSQKKPALIITYPEALFEKVVSRTQLEKSIFKVSIGETLNLDFFNEVLFEYQFSRVDFVTEPGEFSVRGGIVDVFSFSHDEPYRIEFFGDEVESIRTFDIETQLSTNTIKKIQILPNIEHKLLNQTRQSFFEYISSETLIFAKNISNLLELTEKLQQKAREAYDALTSEINYSNPVDLFCTSANFKSQLLDFSVVEFGMNSILATNLSQKVEFQVGPQPSFNKQFNLLIDELNSKHDLGYHNFICCSSSQQAQRFYDIFETVDNQVHCQIIVMSLYEGFVDHDIKLVCYTDHQIFERYHKFNLKNGYTKKQSITLKELTKLEIGDYITHIDHGIGKFGGLQKIEVEGKKQEAIKLFYGERDVLYLSIHALHKITKFNGKDGKLPKIYKLGSKAWKVLKQKTKIKVKEVAFNLIKLYAKRKLETGYRYKPDSSMQHELEASFMYEDTPDQVTATADIKSDMESERPMDRLICGDVGFGKTEVAIRAAFKAVDNGKQVAILVPTTILAFQHAKTFRARFKDFPVTIDYINRFKTTKQRKDTLEQLESGQLDIIIGTHQLVNKSVKFKDLGLLIVDEEQKFGVAVKEKLKTLKDNVDVLTLTATPIPRTLQFSLMAARDLSVINTPPPNRYPIESQVIRLNETIIRDAISYEIQRSGQVYFIHNRIENIKEVAGLIQRLVPDAKIRVGHGQLEGRKLERLMLDFMGGEFDVLVSTTIVESGLDVPNANTILINNANNFGLSDLHQMRGRVGRSNKKAFCYFITPDFHAMTDDARKRISALEQYTALGSGFNIAMKDLEIRGAGDLLGAEQSGFINDIGFETYQKILREAVEELKNKEFEDLFENKSNDSFKLSNFKIDTDLEILFPDNYINNVKVRLNQYQKLSTIYNLEELKKFNSELEDRFGKLPSQSQDLIKTIELKLLAIKNGFEKLILKNEKMICQFISNKEDKFYSSGEFGKILQTIQKNQNLCQLKEKKSISGERLLLVFQEVTSIEKAIKCLEIF